MVEYVLGLLHVALGLFGLVTLGASVYSAASLVRNLRDRRLLTGAADSTAQRLGAAVLDGKYSAESHPGGRLTAAFLSLEFMTSDGQLNEDKSTLVGASEFRLRGSMGDVDVQLPREVFTDNRFHWGLGAGGELSSGSGVLSSGNIRFIFRKGWHYEHDQDASALAVALERFPELSLSRGDGELQGADLFEFEADAILTIVGKPLSNDQESKSGGAYRESPRTNFVVAPPNNSEHLIISDFSRAELAEVLSCETPRVLAVSVGLFVLGVAAGIILYALA